MKRDEKVILIDADVISHFIVGGYITTLPSIFPKRIKILDKVYKELERTPKRKAEISNLINMKLFELVSFPEHNEEIKKEYFRLTSKEFKGEGESACMAVARFSDDVLASSNLKDIKAYCEEHKIEYMTTMDILCYAMGIGKMTLDNCNEFLQRTKNAGQKLPVSRIEDYNCKASNEKLSKK